MKLGKNWQESSKKGEQIMLAESYDRNAPTLHKSILVLSFALNVKQAVPRSSSAVSRGTITFFLFLWLWCCLVTPEHDASLAVCVVPNEFLLKSHQLRQL